MWLGWREKKEKLMHDLLWWNERQPELGNEMGNCGNFRNQKTPESSARLYASGIKKQPKAAGEDSKILESHHSFLVSTW